MFEHALSNIFIICFLYFSLFWSDSKHPLWSRPLEKWSKWFVYLGLDHGWHMFSPPPKAEIRLEAEILFEDGNIIIWNSDDFEASDTWQSFLHMRRVIYIFGVGGNKLIACRSALATYLRQAHTTTQQKPTVINLYLIHHAVPDPEKTHQSFSPAKDRILIHKWTKRFDDHD